MSTEFIRPRSGGGLTVDNNDEDFDDDDTRDVSDTVKNICLELGLSPFYESRDDAEYAIRLTQCHAHRGFRVNRNDKREYCIKCAHEACPFFITTRFSKKKGEFVHDGHVTHTCDINDHVIYDYPSPAAHSGFLVKYLRTHICSGIKSNKQLIQKVIEELGCTVSTSTMNRTLNIANETYLNNQTEGYDLLYAYATHIRQHGGYVHLETTPSTTRTAATRDSGGGGEHTTKTTHSTTTTAATAAVAVAVAASCTNASSNGMSDNGEALPITLDGGSTTTGINNNNCDNNDGTLEFVRIFVSLREQVQYLAPYIEYVSFDAFPLLGMYGGTLLTASSKDPNGDVILVAQAITSLDESMDEWNYFFHHFQMSGLGRNITFIVSDRDHQVICGAETIIFNIPRAKCLRSITEQFQKRFGTDMVPLLHDLANAYTWPEYTAIRGMIRTSKWGDPMMDWIDRTDPDMWCRALFPLPRFDITTSNAVEIDATILKDVKHVPVLELLLTIEQSVLLQRQRAQHTVRTMTSTIVTDIVVKKIREESRAAVYCQCRSTSPTTATVTCTKNNTVHEFAVDIANMTCTCHMYQERLIPCCHAIKFITSILKARPELHCGSLHSVDRLRQMYTTTTTNETDHLSTSSTTATTVEQLIDIGRVVVVPPPSKHHPETGVGGGSATATSTSTPAGSEKKRGRPPKSLDSNAKRRSGK